MNQPVPEGVSLGRAARHYALLQDLRDSSPTDPLAADAPTATINNPSWFQTDPDGTLAPTEVRGELHDRIVEEVLGSGQPAARGQQPVAILLAGPPGAGKSTILRNIFERNQTAITAGLALQAFEEVPQNKHKSR